MSDKVSTILGIDQDSIKNLRQFSSLIKFGFEPALGKKLLDLITKPFYPVKQDLWLCQTRFG